LQGPEFEGKGILSGFPSESEPETGAKFKRQRRMICWGFVGDLFEQKEHLWQEKRA
jgi:hypothetical protein